MKQIPPRWWDQHRQLLPQLQHLVHHPCLPCQAFLHKIKVHEHDLSKANDAYLRACLLEHLQRPHTAW